MNRTQERLLLLLLAGAQFTHITDFMVLLPLGPQLMRELEISPAQFSRIVASYSVAAGIVGLLAAPYLDRFNRRSALLLVYAGFILGTLACAASRSAAQLLLARAACGACGGVSGALVLAIVADVVPPERRAAGMGIIMTALSAAAALGVPTGLFLAQALSWEAPFGAIAAVSLLNWVLLWKLLPVLAGHLAPGGPRGWGALRNHLVDPNARWGLVFMAMLVFGHFTVIPLLSPFFVHNLGLPEAQLSLFYLFGGIVTVFTAPFIGRLSDRVGRRKVYVVIVLVASTIVLAIVHSPRLPPGATLGLGTVFWIFASGRFVPGQAILSLIVPPERRGSYMSLVACTRDFASGLTATVGGWIVIEGADGTLTHFDRLGWIAVTCSLLSVIVAFRVRAVDLGAR